MASTYSQIYIQIIFTVKGRENLMAKQWRDELHKYIVGVIRGKEQKPIIVNGVEDHVHCFVGLKPSISISDLTRDIKNNSSRFINENRWVKGKFQWQEGYGAFSYSHSQISRVYDYVLGQEEHHRTKTFKEEYLDFLNRFQIEYRPEFLFDWIE